MSTAETFLLACILFAVGYPILKRLLLEWAQPCRMRMVAIAKEVMQSATYSEDDKRFVRATVEKAWSPWAPLLYLLCSPALFFVTIEEKETPLERDPLSEEFIDCDIKSSLAANPFVTALLVFVILIVAFIRGRRKAVSTRTMFAMATAHSIKT